MVCEISSRNTDRHTDPLLDGLPLRNHVKKVLTHLNWQKMSAYSAEMLEACRTVTLKVNVLPILR